MTTTEPAVVQRLPISVIIPVFGRQDLALRAVRSVLAQSKAPAEIIVVDDGSNRAFTLADLSSGAVSISIHRHAENRGAAAARNTGIDHASSEWITFLDSDDTLLPDSLERRWAAIQRVEQSEGVSPVAYACGWFDIDADGRRLGGRIPRPATDMRDVMSGCWYSPGTCLMVRRDTLRQSGVRQDESLRRFEDYDWFMELAVKGVDLRVQQIVGAQITRSRTVNPSVAEASACHMLKKWRGRRIERALLKRVEAYLALECASANYYAGNLSRTALYLAKSFAAVPRLSLQLSPGRDDAP